MLLGEYAVLHGYPALLCAVNKRLRVSLTPRQDTTITLSSDRYDQYVTSISDLHLVDPYRFVLAIFNLFATKFTTGCDIHIESDFSDQIGFGSSAALVAATLSAINEWLQLALSPQDMVRYGRQVVQTVQQGRGSGADVAASVFGGVVSYRMTPCVVERFQVAYPLVACYAGFKTKTAVAIQQIEAAFKPHSALFEALLRSIGECASDGIESVRQGDWQRLGKLFSIQQGLMTALGVNLPILQQLVEQLDQTTTILGAKISGAGLGDCVIGLGVANPDCVIGANGASYIPVEMSQEGAICERHG